MPRRPESWVSTSGSGRFDGARERVFATRDRVISSRSRSHRVDVALRTWERDVEAGGSLMAAALAFRTFLWTLPATLFTIGVLGFTVDDDPRSDRSGCAATPWRPSNRPSRRPTGAAG